MATWRSPRPIINCPALYFLLYKSNQINNTLPFPFKQINCFIFLFAFSSVRVFNGDKGYLLFGISRIVRTQLCWYSIVQIKRSSGQFEVTRSHRIYTINTCILRSANSKKQELHLHRNLDFQWNHQPLPKSCYHYQVRNLSPQRYETQNINTYPPFHQYLQLVPEDARGINAVQTGQPEERQLKQISEYAKRKRRMGMKTTEGEIVQVEGGHIVRSTGRKDRHSKVYTAKGPRDRRVRLSAHTAIQFYDVQDRLGYDRPSKAVDWLMKKAKSAIDKLAELPPWNPLIGATAVPDTEPNAGSSEMQIAGQTESSGYNFQQHNHSAFASHSFDSETVDDTMKSFFPTSATTSSIHFQNYPGDIISRTTNPTEDLGLSLHFLHGQSQGSTSQAPRNDQTLFTGSAPVGYDTNYHRLVTWDNESNADTGRGGFIFSAPSLLGQGSAFSQRGTLQSSFSPSSFRLWGDIPIASSDNNKPHSDQQPSVFGSQFLSDGLPGFCFPTRVHGDEEDHAVSSDRPSPPPAPPNAHH